MKEKIKYLMNKKSFHFSVIMIMIVIILFILGLIVLKYNVEGETNMPFTISKITILSSVEGVDQENPEARWDFSINQNNDIYLYMDKNDNYGKVEAIDSIRVDNFNVQKQNALGETKIFKLEGNPEESILKTKEDNHTDYIEFIAQEQADIKQSKITNQGGLVAFRCSNYKIGQYVSNEEEIIHSQLLQKAGIQNDDLKATLTFDVTIRLQSKKEFKANIKVEIPVQNVVEMGTTSTEITDLNDLVFKRIKN